MNWFEDMRVGRCYQFGSIDVQREDTIDFARKFDPQPFHLDDAAAAANPLFGRLAASGWHTAAMGMRMTADYWAEMAIARSSAVRGSTNCAGSSLSIPATRSDVKAK